MVQQLITQKIRTIFNNLCNMVKAQSNIHKKKVQELVVIFLHINARKCHQNLFNQCETIVVKSIEFIVCHV
jgi:hypothetical protein